MLGFRIKRVTSWSMWWPFQVISGGNAKGFILCGYSHLVIRLLPGASGVLPACRECQGSATDRVSNLAVKFTDVLVPWSQVYNSLDVTDAVMTVTVMVGAVRGTFSELSKQSTPQTETCVDLVIAPCPSIDLRVIMQHRIKMSEVRDEMVRFTDLFFLSPTTYVLSGKSSLFSPLSRDHKDTSFKQQPAAVSANNASPTKVQFFSHDSSKLPTDTTTTSGSAASSPGRRSKRFSLGIASEAMRDSALVPHPEPVAVVVKKPEPPKQFKAIWSDTEVSDFFLRGRIIAEMLEDATAESFPFLKIHTDLTEKLRRLTPATNTGDTKPRVQYYVQTPPSLASALGQLLRYYRARTYAATLLHIFEFFATVAKLNNPKPIASLTYTGMHSFLTCTM